MRGLVVSMGCVIVGLSGCSGSKRTVGDICQSVADSACARYRACDPTAPTMQACTAVLVRDCCETGRTCGEEPASTEAAVRVCEQDLAVWSCPAAKDGDLPSSCVAVGRPAAGPIEGGDEGPSSSPRPSPSPSPSTPAATPGTLALTWSLTDPYGYTRTCAQGGAATVEVVATPGSGSATKKSFDCNARAGLVSLAPDYYTVVVRLLGASGNVVDSAPGENLRVYEATSTPRNLAFYVP